MTMARRNPLLVFIGLISLLVAGCAHDGASNDGGWTGFVGIAAGVAPVSRSYRGTPPPIAIAEPEAKTIIVYTHGITRPQVREDCSRWYNRVPKSVIALTARSGTRVYFLCAPVIDGPSQGSYIYSYRDRIENVLDEILDQGVAPDRIFLAGHSAGAWASLMLMDEVGRKFNAAILFAPACCGPRSEVTRYPQWRTQIRPAQVRDMLDVARIDALVFAYADDPYNRPADLAFLTDAFPATVSIVEQTCGHEHTTHLRDCREVQTWVTIRDYVDRRAP